jgi:hypothetical protein
VSIAADTTYVAAYFTTSGWSADGTYFLTRGVDAPPLHTAASSADRLNGVYVYGPSAGFPTVSRGANYWVDVSFAPTASLSARVSGGTSIWTTVAPNERWTPDKPVTLGVKIRSDSAGQITGIRFWKDSASDNGTHVALLYSNTGTLLAWTQFTGETSSGWQQADFSSPVAITPNTTYIAAYFSTSGWSAASNYFSGKGADSPPLHALANGIDGLNGLYSYGLSPQFPVSSRSASYSVDVVFKLR